MFLLVTIMATHMESGFAFSLPKRHVLECQTETLMDALKKETWSRRIRPQDWATMRWLLKSNYRTDRGKRWPEGPKKKKGGAGKERKSWDIVFFEIPKVTWWYGYGTSLTCKAKSRCIDWGQRLPHSLMSPQPHCSYFESHFLSFFAIFCFFGGSRWWPTGWTPIPTIILCTT